MWEPIVQQRAPHGVYRVILRSARPQLKLPKPTRMRQKGVWQFVLRSPVLQGLRYVYWILSSSVTTNTLFCWIHFDSREDFGVTSASIDIDRIVLQDRGTGGQILKSERPGDSCKVLLGPAPMPAIEMAGSRSRSLFKPGDRSWRERYGFARKTTGCCSLASPTKK